MQQPVRIIGIDPGSRITGYGVIDTTQSKSVYVASGCIDAAGENHADRLHCIFDALREILATHTPHELAIESG